MPEEGDIYAILKYLALVYPQRGKAPEPPKDENSYQIVFTAQPQKYLDLGWTSGRLFTPYSLPRAGAAT